MSAGRRSALGRMSGGYRQTTDQCRCDIGSLLARGGVGTSSGQRRPRIVETATRRLVKRRPRAVDTPSWFSVPMYRRLVDICPSCRLCIGWESTYAGISTTQPTSNRHRADSGPTAGRQVADVDSLSGRFRHVC